MAAQNEVVTDLRARLSRVQAAMTERGLGGLLLYASGQHTMLRMDQVLYLGDVRVLRDWVNVEWGGFSMVEAMLAPMRAAVAGGEFDWLVLLSGQHYPVSPLPEIERFLAATEFDGFVDLGVVVAQPERLRGPGRDGARLWRRYYFGYRRMPLRSEQLPDAVGAALRRLAWAVSDNQRLVSVWPMPEGTRWRAGSAAGRPPPARTCSWAARGRSARPPRPRRARSRT